MRRVATILALVLCACVVTKPAAKTSADSSSSKIPAEEQLVAKIESLSNNLRGKSCNAYADTLHSWVQRESDEVHRLAEKSQTQPSLSEQQLAVLEERLVSAFQSIMSGHEQCTDHSGASDAFGQLAALVKRS